MLQRARTHITQNVSHLQDYAKRACALITRLAPGIALGWLGTLFYHSLVLGQSLNYLIVAAISAAFIFTQALYNWIHWTRAANKLKELTELARFGAAPIDELSKVEGGLHDLATGIQQLLRDLRQQRADVAKLHHEINQRVASRTDALERKLGTLQVQANRDTLTGLLNRRAMDQGIAAAITSATKKAEDLCLLMIDVDNFKPLNDSLGHPAGDQLLREIGQIIRSTLRDTEDMAFRVGGDEFVVLLSGCDEKKGAAVARRLESLVESLTSTMKVTHQPRLSIGIANLIELSERTSAALLEAADQKLYDVKRKRPRVPRKAG